MTDLGIDQRFYLVIALGGGGGEAVETVLLCFSAVGGCSERRSVDGKGLNLGEEKCNFFLPFPLVML